MSVGLSALAGRPVVAAMGYTSCKDICPAIVADMMWIEKHLPQDAAGRVRFVFASLIRRSTRRRNSRLTRTSTASIRAAGRCFTATTTPCAILRLRSATAYRPDGQGGFDHAAVISLIDDKGEIVLQQRGTRASSDELLAALNSLLEKRN